MRRPLLLAALCVGGCDLLQPDAVYDPRYVDVASGASHTCALTDKAETYCWGTLDQSGPGWGWNRPTRLQDDPGLAQIRSSLRFSCGLTPGGVAYCWGRNMTGSLGDGGFESRLVPRPVAGGLHFARLADLSISEHACGIPTSGPVHCWGANQRRQLGAGVNDGYWPEPTPVSGDVSFRTVTLGGNESCGLAMDRTLFCWGEDGSGLNGVNLAADRHVPTWIPTDLVLDTVALAPLVMCGLAAGRAHCRGFNHRGTLGAGNWESHAEFVAVTGDRAFTAIGLGGLTACAVTAAGEGFCWGDGGYGKLGNGSHANAAVPVPVAGSLRFRKISPGSAHTCGLTLDGRIYCWGQNVMGQLGNGNAPNSAVPVRVIPPEG